MEMKVVRTAAPCRGHSHLQRARMHATRAQPGEVSLADQQPGRRGLPLLWERAGQRATLLPGGTRASPIGRPASQQRGCVSDDTTAAPPRSVMNSRRFIRSSHRRACAVSGLPPITPTICRLQQPTGYPPALSPSSLASEICPARKRTSAASGAVHVSQGSPARREAGATAAYVRR